MPDEPKRDTKPTINDVARLSGVSKKTVSRVINKSPLLNQATREKVEAVIAEIGYVPNPQARALALLGRAVLLGDAGRVAGQGHVDPDADVGLHLVGRGARAAQADLFLRGEDHMDLGAAALADFQHVCKVVADLAADPGSEAGGVWLNVGCAVILPEIFLKAVSVAINLGVDLGAITTGNLDMIRQYRAETNVVRRPPGEGITLVGQHELLLPLLRMAVLSKLPRVDLDQESPR